jgi:hypothetical protein
MPILMYRQSHGLGSPGVCSPGLQFLAVRPRGTLGLLPPSSGGSSTSLSVVTWQEVMGTMAARTAGGVGSSGAGIAGWVATHQGSVTAPQVCHNATMHVLVRLPPNAYLLL